MDLTGKIALVTGASRGIGEAIANTLASAGATVIGTAQTEKNAQAIGKRLAQLGTKNSVGRLLNINENNSIESLVESIIKEIGGISILVNNAGITRDGLLMRMNDDDWDEIIDINLKSVYRASKAVIRHMMKVRTGRIINIASIVGVMGNAGQTNYAASKAGMIGFSKAMAQEVGSRNITVNCVAPGFIDTDMTRALSEEQRANLVQNIALGRLGVAQDVADAVLFLSSNKATYITGQTIHVNGGMLMP